MPEQFLTVVIVVWLVSVAFVAGLLLGAETVDGDPDD